MTEIPKIVLGTYQMPDYESLRRIVACALDAGVSAFDTAPSYGTEGMLGRTLKETAKGRESLFCSDKIDAIQMYHGNIKEHVEQRLLLMDIGYFDLLLIHWPLEQYMANTWKQMQVLKAEGKVKAIGICNVRVRHLEHFAKMGIVPDYVQNERHPLNTCDAEVAYCHGHCIKVMAYSPLGRMLPEIRNSKTLKDIANRYHKNIGQVILRWQIDTGAIPVFGTKKESRLKDNINIFDFTLTDNEKQSISAMNTNTKIFLESWGCPKY